MAVDQTAVLAALREVQDPELHRSIVELEMVRNVAISGGNVDVLVALTVAGCPMRAEITQRVTDAVMRVDGVQSVGVDMTVMTPQELSALRDKMAGQHVAPGQSGHGHEHSHSHNPFTGDTNTRVIGITSGKGGVGKSSVTVNLAVALAQDGYKVAVLDADVYGFSIPKMLGVTDEPEVSNDRLVPPTANGVSCISVGFFADDDKPIMWRGPMLHKALEQFLSDVEWGEPDFLLVDMPPGTGDVAISMAEYIPNAEIYVVTTPQPAAQRVAQRSGAMAREINLPLAGVIENMSWFTGDDAKRYEIFGQGGGEELAKSLGVPLLGQIPLVVELREGSDVGSPVVVSNPESEAAFVFSEIARTIAKSGRRRVHRPELKINQ